MMEKYKLTAVGLDHSGWVLNQILSLHVIRSLDSPADGLEVRALVEEAPPDFGRVRFQRDGELLFEGAVDEQLLTGTQMGLVLELRCRTDGALLLDNESLPMAYENCTLTDLAKRCLAPYGHFQLGFSSPVSLPVFTVAKGWSDWQAICRFCTRAVGRRPTLGKDGFLRVAERPVRWHLLSNEQIEALHYLRFSWADRRCEVISKVCLRDRNGYYPTAVENPLAEELGVRRKRYLIPASEYANQPALDANRLIQTAMAKRHTLTLELPGLENLEPGDGLLLKDRAFPKGEMTVAQLEWKVSGEGWVTKLELVEPQYAQYWGE